MINSRRYHHKSTANSLYSKIILSFLMMSVLGCAFNNSKDDIYRRENKVIEEKNQVLRENFNHVTGFYQGRLQLPGEERTVTLGIYTLEVREGTNSTGEPIFRPVLKAVYRQLYPVDAPVLLDGNYNPDRGTLTFGVSSKSTNAIPIDTIEAYFENSKISGLVKTTSGVLGQLDLDFVQKRVDTPSEGDDEHLAEKLREQYSLITGTYTGTITSEDPQRLEQNVWNIEVGLYVHEVKAGTKPTGETFFRPVLKAIFKQLNPVAPNLSLDVQFITETKQLLFINPNVSNGNLQSINAKLINKTIQGKAQKSGLWGQVHLEWTSKKVDTDPAGEENEFNRRLEEQFKKITGTYQGRILREASGYEARREWKVEMGLYITKVKDGASPSGEPRFKPALKAKFKQLSPVAPDVILDVQYIVESQELFLSINEVGVAPNNSDGLHSLSATINNNTIQGRASRVSGDWGDLSLKFERKEVEAPSSGDIEDYNRRLLEEYNLLVGFYTGTISPQNKEFDSFKIEVKVSIKPPEPGTNSIPKLIAYYRRTSDKVHATDLTMNVDFKTELSPAGVEMFGQRNIGNATYFVTLTGQFKNKEIQGQYGDHRAQRGTFRLKRK